MDQITATLICVGLMLIMLNTGLPIALSLGMSGLTVGLIVSGNASLHKLGWTTFQSLYNSNWISLPMFMFMGTMIAQTKIGEDLFKAARLWLSRLPGGLIVSAIFGQAGMAAVLGSAAPTILSIGPIAMPELERYNYDRRLSLGALTTGGTLGPLIPPSSMAIIISGLVGETVPLGQLLIAGIIPGIVLAFLLSLVPIIKCSIDPSLGAPVGTASWSERFKSLKRVWPVAVTFFAVLLSIFFGIATATEAGAVGALVTLLVSVFAYRARTKQIYQAVVETVTINAQVLFIIIGASFFTYVIGSSTLAKQLSEAISNVGSPIMVIILIQVLLLLLGCFLDAMTIIMVAIPFLFPLVTSMGFSPLWFAVLFMVNMEIGLVSPPMGVNFFLVRNIFKIDGVELFKGTAPYMVVLVLFLALLVAFPQLSTWLPALMMD